MLYTEIYSPNILSLLLIYLKLTLNGIKKLIFTQKVVFFLECGNIGKQSLKTMFYNVCIISIFGKIFKNSNDIENYPEKYIYFYKAYVE